MDEIQVAGMDKVKMEMFIKKDRYAAFLFKGFKRQGMDDSKAYEILYSMILDDSGMKQFYDSL